MKKKLFVITLAALSICLASCNTGSDNSTDKSNSDSSQNTSSEDSSQTDEKCKVTYHLNGGTLKDRTQEFEMIKKGDCLNLPLASRDGYSFLGWWIESTNVNNPSRQWFDTDAVFTDIDLYAHWQENTYTITLNPDGGAFDGESVLSVKYLDEYQLPDDVKKSGYSFIGWFDGNTKISFSGIYSYTRDITLIAKYEELPIYIITLNPNGGVCETSSVQAEYNGQYQLPSYESVTRDNYVFMGWYDGENKWEFTGTYSIKGNITLAAKWEEKKTYNIQLNFNGGSYDNSSENLQFQITNENRYNGGERLPIPTREGYTFKGYSKEMSLFTDYDLLFNWTYLTNNNVFKALWLANDGSLNGDVFEIGRYPQSLLVDGTIIENLQSKNPVLDGYYSLDDNTYYYKNEQWFCVEPILWYVLDRESGLVTTMFSMDSIYYYKCGAFDNPRTIDGVTVYPNNYKYSNARAWLNGLNGTNYNVNNYKDIGFYDVAFNESEKAKIKNDVVINYSSSNPYSCDDTQDKVFLLSNLDGAIREDMYNVLPQTDFSANNNSVSTTWWTRIPTYYSNDWIDAVGYNGRYPYRINTYSSPDGVRPAIRINS